MSFTGLPTDDVISSKSSPVASQGNKAGEGRATIVILGFRGGIGGAITKRIAEQCLWKGVPIEKVVAVDFLPTPDALTSAATALTAVFRSAQKGASGFVSIKVLHWNAADVESTKCVADNIDQITRFVDCLVVTTGLGFHGDLNKLSIMDNHKSMERLNLVNFVGPSLLTAHLAKKMPCNRLGRGAPTIVMLSSYSGLVGLPHRAAYCASKFALNGFMEGLVSDMPHLRVTLVCPTSVDTGFRDAWKKELGSISTGVKDNVKAAVTLDDCATTVWDAINSPKGPGLSYVVLKGLGATIATWLVRVNALGIDDAVRKRVLVAANKL